jgi:hypothetical protein
MTVEKKLEAAIMSHGPIKMACLRGQRVSRRERGNLEMLESCTVAFGVSITTLCPAGCIVRAGSRQELITAIDLKHRNLSPWSPCACFLALAGSY